MLLLLITLIAATMLTLVSIHSAWITEIDGEWERERARAIEERENELCVDTFRFISFLLGIKNPHDIRSRQAPKSIWKPLKGNKWQRLPETLTIITKACQFARKYTYRYRHIYIYIYMYLCYCICKEKTAFVLHWKQTQRTIIDTTHTNIYIYTIQNASVQTEKTADKTTSRLDKGWECLRSRV